MSSNPNTGSNAAVVESTGNDIRPLGGAIYGAIAFVVGYVSTAALFVSRLEDLGSNAFEVFGFVFYNAHTIDVVASDGSESETLNPLEIFEVGNTLHFRLVPAVILLVAGFVLASRVSGPLSRDRAAKAGASVAIGYVSLLVAGTFVFEIEDVSGTIAPELGPSLVVIGLLYTVLCGGLGGYLAGD